MAEKQQLSFTEDTSAGHATPDNQQLDRAKEADSKEIVLNAAQALIKEHGFNGLSMRELARHAGIAKGTIYHHFQDKCEIYLSVLERDIYIVRDRLLAVVDGPAAHQYVTIADKLRAFVKVYFELQQERRLVIMSALRENSVLDEKFGEILKKYRSELLQPIGALIREGIESEEIRPVNVELTVLSLLGILQGFVVHQIILENAEIDESVIDHIVTLLTHGISASSPASSQTAGHMPGPIPAHASASTVPHTAGNRPPALQSE